MVNNREIVRVASAVQEATRRWFAIAGGFRAVAAVAAALALAATIALLYAGSQRGDVRKQHEILGHLRELKEIDARWDTDVWRRRIEFPPPGARVDYAGEFTRHREALAKAAERVNSPVLAHGLPDLDKALKEKVDLFTRFGKAADATRQALRRVAGADAEMAGLVRGSWRDFPERERLVALENAVMQVLTDAHKYYLEPDDAQRANVDALVSDLRNAGERFPPALKAGIGQLDKNVQDLVRTRVEEKMLSDRLAFQSAGPRIDSLTRALNGEVEQVLMERQLYAIYLSALAAALLILVAYLLARLVAGRPLRANADPGSAAASPAPETYSQSRATRNSL